MVDPTIIVAGIGAGATVAGAFIQDRRRSNRSHAATQGRIDNLETLLSTNHGRRPGEYLEMIAETKTSALLTQGMVEAIGLQLGAHIARPVDEAHAPKERA